MSNFEIEFADDVISQLNYLDLNCEKMLGKMTRAGAKVVIDNVKKNVPKSWKKSNIMRNISLTRTYKTSSDDGINTKVIISGYYINSRGVKTPASLIANIFEFGSSVRKFNKQSFFRRSFNKRAIEQAILEEQHKASGGLL